MMMKRLPYLGTALIFGLAFSFLFVSQAFAADQYWTGNAATSTYGGKDFWNAANWDTNTPSSGDNIWLFATSSPNNTVVISTPIDLGAGKVYIGYNQKGNTAGNSAAPLTLIIREGASLTTTGIFSVGTSSTVLITSGTLNVGTTTIQQLASTTISAATGATSTAIFTGNFTFGNGALYTAPTNSTTTIIAMTTTNTVSSTSTLNTFGYLNLSGTGTIQFQMASSTVSNRLRIDPTVTYNGSTNSTTGFPSGVTINLLGGDTNSNTFPFEPNGTFTVSTTTVVFGGSTAATVASTTYYNVTFTGATYTLRGTTTVTNSAIINSGTTLALGAKTFTATGATWTNNGTVTRTTGKITHASTAIFSDSNGIAKTSFSAPSAQVCVNVTNTALNYDASTAETQSATVTTTGLLNDSETVTLTETGAATGIFNGCLGWSGPMGSLTPGILNFNGNGTLAFSYTNSQDSTDTGSGNASFTGASAGGGGGATGGNVVSGYTAPVFAGATTAATPAVPAIPATPATPATSTTLATPATPTTPAQPTTIEGVQARIADLMARIRELQGQPAAGPQGAALGFNFVRPLVFGMRGNNDVRNLQSALKTDPTIYPEGIVNGNFGPATKRAVQRFQVKYNLAKPGDAGYGKVGPRTRAKLNELYRGK